MDKKCENCIWYIEDTMVCMNENSDVCMSGPWGVCQCFEGDCEPETRKVECHD